MKKILFSTILALAATGTMTLTTSCEDQLDIEQKGVIPTENFYKTDADAEAALVAAYEGFMCNVMGRNHDGGGPGIYTPLKLIVNECGDDVLAAGANSGDNTFGIMLNQFYYDAEAEVPKFMYTGLYLSVYTCNLVLDHFADATTAVQKRCAAEARVLRAYDYFLLANLWGTPPLVTHVLDASAQPVNCDKDPENPMDHKQLIEWIAQECENAANDLDERKSKDDKDGAVKVTKGFAYALAGKAYLFAGQYDKAKTALKKVIDSGKYDLVPGEKYADNFHIEGDANEEKVFEVNFEYNAGKTDWGGMEDRKFVRESVAEIYRQIESDLKEAITCFKASNLTKTCFRWNLPATYLLASRVSLYKKEYDKAIEYATYVIAAQPQLYDLSAMSDDDYFLNEKNPEILFTYGYYLVSYYAWLAKCNFPISDDLQALYGDNDWRLTHFFYKRRAVYTARKSETSGTTGIYGYAFRTAEAYLNRAEAYAGKGDKDKALQDLKTIREKRLKVYEEVQAVTKEDVIRRVREERRRELSFEFHRWFDLRRWDRPRERRFPGRFLYYI